MQTFTNIKYSKLQNKYITDKPHDASRKIDHIPLPTEYNYPAMSVG